MAVADAAVLDALDCYVLDPTVISRALELALADLTAPTAPLRDAAEARVEVASLDAHLTV